jgi:hypothetical protein
MRTTGCRLGTRMSTSIEDMRSSMGTTMLPSVHSPPFEMYIDVLLVGH